LEPRFSQCEKYTADWEKSIGFPQAPFITSAMLRAAQVPRGIRRRTRSRK